MPVELGFDPLTLREGAATILAEPYRAGPFR
jgi:hypothetical protein